jgi:hypothetical protein
MLASVLKSWDIETQSPRSKQRSVGRAVNRHRHVSVVTAGKGDSSGHAKR